MTVDVSAVARVVGIETAFKNLRGAAAFLPMRIALIGQGATLATYALTKRQILSAAEAGSVYGFGSPIHLAAKQLLPENGDGVGTIPVTVYPLEDDVSGVASAGSITPSAGPQTAVATFRVKVNNILSEQFTLNVGDVIADATAAITAAINAVVDMPVIAVDNTTVVDLTAKWEGVSGDDIVVEIEGTPAGITFAVVQPTGGAANPDIQDALDLFSPNIWESLILNCLDIADTVALGKLQTFGDGRWGELAKIPFIAFTGTVEADVATAITIPEARKTDKINSQLVEPGGVDLPFVVAARQLARIARIANNNPPVDYAGQQATDLVPGDDTDQWNYIERDTAVKGGSSTIEVVDGVVEMSDTVTFYHPTGELNPAYRYVVSIIKVMNVLFNLRLIFEADDWKGKVLIPDGQPTVNPDARSPKDAKAAIAKMLTSLGLEAIVADPETAIETITAQISPTNPNRLDVEFTYQISGNTNIISVLANFGFFFGAQAAAA